MISIRVGQNGLDALRAYNPQRLYYSGLNGVLALLGHCVVEVVYQRAYEPQRVEVATNRRYDRVRNAQGRFVTIVTTPTVTRTEYRDRTPRSVVPVNSNWLGAKYRRMLITRDFAMLNSWGAQVFGFRPPSGGIHNQTPDVLVVWDCLWHDWRRIKITEPISISCVLPTTMYPGIETSARPDKEAIRLIEIQKRVLFNIYESNFHGKRNALFSYMDNRVQLNLQYQEENLRKKYFKDYEDHQEELRKRRIKDAERRRKQAEERARLQADAEKQAIQNTQEQTVNQQEELNMEEKTANDIATDRQNIEKPGNVEVRPDGTAELQDDITEATDNANAPTDKNRRRFR